MRKTFLDNLPKRGKLINWKESIGLEVRFIYDEIEGSITIVDYDNSKVTIKYKDKFDKIKSQGLKKCQIGNILKKKTRDYIYAIGDKIKTKSKDLIITNKKIERKFRDNGYYQDRKYYQIRCNKCGFSSGEHYTKGIYKKEYWISEGGLKKLKSCPCCCNSPQIVVTEINSLWKTDYWMIQMGIDLEWAKKNTSCSNKKAPIKCPYCGKIRYKKPNEVYNKKSIGCVCGEGISYPEKVMVNILNQLNINHIYQLSKTTFKWCNNYRYDFYLPDYNCIIEINGEQHYRDCTGFSYSLKEIQNNDKHKKELALINSIKSYIVIDCRKSELTWAKRNIIKSELNEILKISNIDWKLCEKNSLSNKVKDLCDYWSSLNGNISLKKLNDIFKTTQANKYLIKGTSIGWCNPPYMVKRKPRKIKGQVQ